MKERIIGTLKGAKLNGEVFDATVTRKLEWDVDANTSSKVWGYLWRNFPRPGLGLSIVQQGRGMLLDAQQELGGWVYFDLPLPEENGNNAPPPKELRDGDPPTPEEEKELARLANAPVPQPKKLKRRRA